MRKNVRKLFLLSLVLALLSLSENGWATLVAKPHAVFEGFMQTYSDNGQSDDLIFTGTTITGVVLSDGSTPVDDPIIGTMMTISGAQRTDDDSFTNATFTITDGVLTYLTATLSNINFTVLNDQWYLNPGLDSNDSQTLNLSNIVLDSNGSTYISELATALGSNSVAGMQMILDVYEGSISGNSSSFVYGLIAAPAVAPEPVSSILFLSGGVTMGLRLYRKKKKQQV